MSPQPRKKAGPKSTKAPGRPVPPAAAKADAGRTKRAEPETFRARSLSVSLTANDLQKSVAWYRDAVGFVVGREIQRDGKVVAVAMKAGSVEIMLNQDDGAKGWNRTKGEGFALYFTTAQRVDDIADRIRKAGTALQSEPADMPWGVRLFRVKDPDGFTLAISSERPA